MLASTLEAVPLEKEPFVAVGIDATHPMIALGLLERVGACARSAAEFVHQAHSEAQQTINFSETAELRFQSKSVVELLPICAKITPAAVDLQRSMVFKTRQSVQWSGAVNTVAATKLLQKTVSDRPSVKPSVSSLVGDPLIKFFVVTVTLKFSVDTVHFLP